MINISFFLNLQKKDTKNQYPIWMTLTFNGLRIRKSVKNSKVKEGDWIASKSRVKKNIINSLGVTGELINANLEELEESIRRINKVVLRDNIKLSEEYILTKLNNPDSIDIQQKGFFPAFQEYINYSKSYKAERTITGYTTVKNFLKDFQHEKKYKLEFHSINADFFDLLREYAFSTKEKPVTDNYFAKIISVLKSFLNWSTDRRYNIYQDYKKFKAPERENEVVYLTKDELFTLYQQEFESKKLEHVRDTFCFACFTGLRFSDVRSLQSSHIIDGYIVKNIEKTKEVSSKIPLNKYALEILNKYKDSIYNPLPVISSQKFNDYIKDCCKEAKINTEVTIVRYKGSNTIVETLPKYQLITSHVARKTFVTNSLILGMKELVVRNITGHKKESSFRRYVKIADDVKKSEMNDTWDKL